MKPFKTILRRTDTIFGENLFLSKRILNMKNAGTVPWKGVKRYAH